MLGIPGDRDCAGQSQVHGCVSYSLSLPSQPPDIKNWFSSYEYESPEVPELAADPGGHNCSETQDPLEDSGLAVREKYSEGQFENEIFAGKYLVPVDGIVLKPPPKRKQSLRALFGIGLLDKPDEGTGSESQVVLPVQGNALQPLSNSNVTGSSDTEPSHEGAIEHSKEPVDCDGISSLDTQVSSPSDQEAGFSEQPIDCDEGFAEDGLDCIKLPVNFVHTNLAGSDRSPKEGTEQIILPVSHNNTRLGDTDGGSSVDEAARCSPALKDKQPQESVSSDGFVAIKRKEKPPVECKMNKIPKHPTGREKGKLQENRGISEQKALAQVHTRSPLADRSNLSEVAAAPVHERSRKWKCPRKSKPYVGPPLKQLRLDRWVSREN